MDLRRACIGLVILLASGCGSVSAPRGAGGGAGTGSGGSADAATGGTGGASGTTGAGGSTGAGGTTGTGGSTVTDAGIDQGGADLPSKTAIWDLPASLWDSNLWGP